jgi:arylsulfatase A-like enzyme
MPDRPNIVLIMVDQWRGDCLSVDNHPTVYTPYLDQLALNGVRFAHAYSATPTCIAARAALFTGLGQRSHGRVGYQDGVPWDYPTTLAGEFTRHGYQTQAVGKMHVYPERSQLGFQNVILHDGFLHVARHRHRSYDLVDDYTPWLREQLGRDADYFEHGINCNSVVARPWDKDEALHPTNYVASQSIDFLRRRDPRKPFFLFMSFHRPHPPYDPPAWAFEMYMQRDIPLAPRGDWEHLLDPYVDSHRPECFVGDVDPWVLRRAHAGYYGHMTHIDGQINRFLEILEEYYLAQNTIVCFTSDHGEMLGEHRLFRKGYAYEGSARVPLLLSGPAGVGIRRGAQVHEAVELRDIMPTLLDCAGLPIPPSVEGRSALPLARGEQVAWRPYFHGEHTILGQAMHWLTDGQAKYIWWSGSGHEQLFDLDADPNELRDLAAESAMAARVSAWRQRLIQELQGREEGFTDGAQLIADRPVHPVLAPLRVPRQ